MSDWSTQGQGQNGAGGGNSFTIFGGFQWAQLDVQAEQAKHEYGLFQKYTEPYLQAGQQNLQAFNDLTSGKVDIRQTPGYQAAFNTGMDALQKQLSAQHQFMGGSALKSAQTFGSQLGEMQYGNEFARRMQAAYAAPPVAYGGNPNLPTLKELNEKYKYLTPKKETPPTGGGGGGGGEDEAQTGNTTGPSIWDQLVDCNDPANARKKQCRDN